MSTSLGSHCSKAAISGALQDVCPPTIAPTLVAVRGHMLDANASPDYKVQEAGK